MDKQHEFYASKAWRELTYNLKIERGGKCERCGARPLHFSSLIGHHKIYLTDDNLDDASISLNPKNIEVICQTCHNKEHDRFHNYRKVYIVYGSPMSGKKTLVNQLMQYGDIVVDMDLLWQAVTFYSNKPNNLRFNVFKLRDDLLDQVKTRYGQWYDAYIVGGYPDKYERERLSQELGAELIYCESTKDECISRTKDETQIEFINNWLEKYSA